LTENSEIPEEPGTGDFEMSRDISMPDVTGIPARIIGVGIDIVASERVGRMLKFHGDRFLDRCFTGDESRFSMSQRDSVQNLAVRLAAKEACFKAIGGRRGMGLGWREFEVYFDDENIPAIRLNGPAKDRAERIGVGHIWLSLTHEDEWSAAVVIMTE
jgi:holo-[acyl-carrier protein] synthase